MKKTIFTAIVLIILSLNAWAEIEKIAIPGDNGLCFYWWPKITPAKGWHHDREHSLSYSANAIAPDGFTFADAETVMYAKAEYKPRIPATTSVEMLISNDQKTFLNSGSTIKINEVAACTTADGNKLRSFTFFPKGKGNWERVSYGEEGDFFLIFTLSSRTKPGFEKANPIYEQLIRQYKEKP